MGDYRIIYKIEDDKPLILIVSLGHHKEIYKKGLMSIKE